MLELLQATEFRFTEFYYRYKTATEQIFYFVEIPFTLYVYDIISFFWFYRIDLHLEYFMVLLEVIEHKINMS